MSKACQIVLFSTEKARRSFAVERFASDGTPSSQHSEILEDIRSYSDTNHAGSWSFTESYEKRSGKRFPLPEQASCFRPSFQQPLTSPPFATSDYLS
jgi:hypothetical protein